MVDLKFYLVLVGLRWWVTILCYVTASCRYGSKLWVPAIPFQNINGQLRRGAYVPISHAMSI